MSIKWGGHLVFLFIAIANIVKYSNLLLNNSKKLWMV